MVRGVGINLFVGGGGGGGFAPECQNSKTFSVNHACKNFKV